MGPCGVSGTTVLFFLSSGGWVKIKLAPTLPRIRYMCVAPVATAARAAATGSVSMSTRPDPERSGAVEIATWTCPRLPDRVVWDLRELTH